MMSKFKFCGAMYYAELDYNRLATQLERVFAALSDGEWKTLDDIERTFRKQGIHGPQNSLQAQCRNLRKVGYRVLSERTIKGTARYQLVLNSKGQPVWRAPEELTAEEAELMQLSKLDLVRWSIDLRSKLRRLRVRYKTLSSSAE